jgi:hypothetical protein
MSCGLSCVLMITVQMVVGTVDVRLSKLPTLGRPAEELWLEFRAYDDGLVVEKVYSR